MAKLYTLGANSDIVTSGEVVPKGTGTEVIATIGGKDIKAPAGGGGTSDYDSLSNRPSINGETLTGNVDLATPESVDDAKDELNARIDLIEATTKPNMNIVGSPKFNQGVVSGFSANDYLMFPTQVNVGQNMVEFYMSFTTGADVTTQQNLLDSWCGLAVAIKNGRFILAASSDGTSFVQDQSDAVVNHNTSYNVAIRFVNPAQGVYLVKLSDEDAMDDLATVELSAPLFPTATYWGGANPQSGVNHIFSGTINLNECRMVWNGAEVWRGYDELPTVKYDPTATPVLDTAEKIVGVVKDAVSLNNRFLVDGTTAAIQTREGEDAEWSDEIRLDKGYDALTGDTVVKLDKSVQTVTVSGSNLEIVLPDAVTGTVRDFCVYANNSGDADTALTFPPGTYYGDDPNGAVAKAGKVTGIYLSEIPNGVWTLCIRELEQHEVTA